MASDKMKCFTLPKSFLFVTLALFHGGIFSSLRGAVIVVTPTDYVSKVAAAQPGDVFQLRNGTYIFSTNSQTIPSGSPTARIAFQKYPGENPIVRNVLLAKPVSYLLFDGLFIDAQKSVSETVYLSTAHHNRFQNCTITNGQTQGVLLPHPGADYNEFIGCDVHHNGTRAQLDHGLYIAASNNLVQGCTIHHNAAFGAQIYNGYGERVNNNVFRSNKVYSNAVMGQGSGLAVSAGDGNIVENNTVQDAPNAGIEVAYKNPTNTKVNGNICTSNAIGISIGTDSTGAQVTNNQVCGNGTPIKNSGTGTVLSGNVTTGCSGSSAPPPPTNVDVSQSQPPDVNSQSSQPSGPSTSQVAIPFLIAGVIGAALLLGD